ncbi:hypothetical protein DU490_12685 [Halomonas sp. DQ26W]|uniref:hypothetical protein n=1 Tax=Halomonas sp. DQ26W TaxID=2282311 RepID=UPI000DF74C20|nr:hypothetical protein [Halomonas sp. DQ26W]RDB42501.1 hypothetical protein DU490_12685 [Halomonas sp. DQ26W]
MSNRDEFVEQMKARLDEWNAEIDELAARARHASDEARVKYEEDIERLKQRRDETRRRLDELQHASEAAWDSLRQGMEESWELMRKAFRDAWRNDIPPRSPPDTTNDRHDDGPGER